MKDLGRVIRFAIAREDEAETFYKEWAQRAPSTAVRVLFGELGAREHGHGQLLAHITPEDLVARSRREAPPRFAEYLLVVPIHPGAGLPDALLVAIQRAEAAARLYDGLAELGGESSALFRSLAAEERRHQQQLKAISSPGAE